MTNNKIYRKALEKINKSDNELFIPRLIVDRKELYDYEIYYVIFSLDFAKAFWGSEDIDDQGRTIDKGWEEEFKDSGLFMDKEDYEYSGEWKIAYHYHIKQMVLEKEPLKYLEKFL